MGNKEYIQPLSDYFRNLIMYHLDDFMVDDVIDVLRLKKQVYMYARKLGYGGSKYELECKINLILQSFLNVVREPGTNLGMKGISDIRDYFLRIYKKE